MGQACIDVLVEGPYPGYADPSGPAYPGFGFPGTTVDPVTGENLMPFANTTFTLDLAKPFTNYLTHLMADPSTNPIRLPNLVDIGRSLQALLAGLVMASDPITPGSPFCPGACSFLPAGLDYPGIVKTIAAIWPGNPLLEGPDGWLTAYANARANGPTQEQIEHSVQILQPDRWDFGNPSPPPEWSKGLNLSKLAPFFHKLWTALGLNPPPLAVPAPATDPAPSIAALRQAPLPSDVQLDAVPEGSEGQKSGGADVLTDKAAQPSEHSPSTTTSTDATVDATEPKVDSPSKTTSTDATVDATEPKVDSPSKTASTNATDDAKKPKATDEGKKFQPRHVRGKDAARSAKSGEAVNGPHTGDGSGTVDHAADAAAPAQ